MSDFQKILEEKLKNAIIEDDTPETQVLEYDVLKEVREAIIEIRKCKNISQKELSEKTGIPQANISKIENGYYVPSIPVLKRIAEGLEKRLTIEFIDETEEI